ncbi:putative ABC transport system permease protein [Paenibacillus phyllosphaerae]|uniref:Putative ABC transport system permease protein n=2 Tax=Paenibacillus phyllosphaerae TaxID=274593 RepID=A0A7W5AVP8_9BACL|nr:putative ABC transport system permease protein [Paenibacillus phyllosphaerae]
MKQSIGQWIALVLVVAVGAFFYAGLSTYSNQLRDYTHAYFEKHHLSDLHVYYSKITKDEAALLSKIDGVQRIEGRYTFETTQSFEEDQAALTIHSIPEPNTINTPSLTEGRIPSHAGELLLDAHYAQEHGYHVGDPIRLTMNKHESTFIISGLGENVEYAKKNEIQDHRTEGFAYTTEDTAADIAGGPFYNELLVEAREGYDIGRLGQAIEQQSAHLPCMNQVSKERTFSYSQLSQTIYNNKLMSSVIPLLLFAIAAIILYLAMSRLIDSERHQIGVMKALGVKNRSIMFHYMGYPLLIGIVGSILGCVLANWIFIPFVTTSNARAYALPGITFSISLISFLPPILISSSFGMLACYLSGRRIVSERAAQAMHPKPPKKSKKLLIERVPWIWQRLPYTYKLISRNMMLNKPRALASSIGVIASTALLITAFGTQNALLQVARQAEEVYSYDLKVDYKPGAPTQSVVIPPGVQHSYWLSSYPVAFVQGDELENATLTVTEPGNRLIHFFDRDGQLLNLDDSGVLVPQSYADKYNIEEGDTIHLQFETTEMRHKTVAMKVIQLTSQYSSPAFYCTPAYLEGLGIDYRPASLVVQAEQGADLNTIRNVFEQDERVAGLADRQDLKESAQYIVQQNQFVFVLFILCAAILSFGAMYTISSINIYERNRELATLKVLGYPKNKIYRLIFLENIILTTFAILVALPVGSYAYTFVIQALSSSHQQIPNQLNEWMLLLSVIVAYALTFLSNVLLRRKVTGIHMLAALKGFE